MVSQSAMLVLLGALVAAANGQEFLGKRKVSAAAVKAELNGVLDEVLGQGHGLADARLRKIHEFIDPLFRALPKNRQGHVSAQVMRYAVRRYFRQTHFWIMRGFEEQGNASSAFVLGDSDMSPTKLPAYIRSLIEDRFAQQGFSLDAVVAVVATLERMNLDETIQGVELAFDLNDIDPTRALSTNEVWRIVTSFVIGEVYESTANKTRHQMLKSHILQRPSWGTLKILLADVILSDMFQRRASSNPFTNNKLHEPAPFEDAHSFEDVVRAAGRSMEEYALWSENECTKMKDNFLQMDVHGTGRVKMSDFYGYTKNGNVHFMESSQQLRLEGVLDESSTFLGPQVMIPNYVTSTTNCVTSKPFYHVACCLNDCDLVYQQLESRIAAPSATVPEIISAFESGIYVPTSISGLHRERLDEIARVSDNRIPLHGRLFASWLHFVYPQECPHPNDEGMGKEQVKAERAPVTDAEIAQHLESDFALRAPSPDAGATMWNLKESLLESSTPSDSADSWIGALLRIAVQTGMLVGFLSMLRPLMQMFSFDAKKKAIEYDV